VFSFTLETGVRALFVDCLLFPRAVLQSVCDSSDRFWAFCFFAYGMYILPKMHTVFFTTDEALLRSVPAYS
jgi:hypothetical protein